MKSVTRRLHTLERLAHERGITISDILQTQEWVSLRTAVLVALEPFPDAQRAVAGALLEVGDDDGRG